MAIVPAPYVRRPYVDQGLVRLSELGRQRGQLQSLSALRAGETSARGWQAIGDAISSGARGIREEREQAPRRAFEQRQMQRVDQAVADAQAAKQADAAKARRLHELLQANGGQRLPSEVLLREFGPDDAAHIDKAFDELFPAPKAAEPFTLNPGDVRYGADGKTIATNPKPVETPAPKMHTVVVPGPNGQPMTRVIPENQFPTAGVPTYRAPSQGPAPEKPSIWLVRDGKDRFVTATDAARLVEEGWKKPAGESKPASGLEKRALNFFNRAQQADVDLEDMETDIAKMGLAGQSYMQWAPNFLQTDLGQRYQQAQRAFTEARLRKDSGAAIPENEFESDRKTYFAQPGDSPETLAQKRRARGAMLASLSFESGQALAEFLGSSDDAKSMVQGYRQRAEKASGAGVASPVNPFRKP